MCAADGKQVRAVVVDHIIPRNAGGTHARDNLQPLCARDSALKTGYCDGGYGNRRHTLEQLLERRKRL